MTIRIAAETPWYDLFSRGARDWLRHNQKVREAVKGGLPELLAGSDLMTGPTSKTVIVPVKFLEHARHRQRNRNRIDRNRHRRSVAAMSGYAFRARSRPSVTIARRRNCSRGNECG